jgi:hypothetical protein
MSDQPEACARCGYDPGDHNNPGTVAICPGFITLADLREQIARAIYNYEHGGTVEIARDEERWARFRDEYLGIADQAIAVFRAAEKP